MARKVPRWKIKQMRREREAEAARRRAQAAQRQREHQKATESHDQKSFTTEAKKWTAADFHRYMATAPYREHEDEKALSWLSGQKMFVDLARSIYTKSVEPTLRQRTAGNSVRISENQLPRIWHIHKTCAARLGIEPPDLYIESDPGLNALSAGLDSPVVVLTSSLVDAFSQPELSFVIGHEIGHVACKHVLYKCTAHELVATLERSYRAAEAQGGRLSRFATYGIGRGGFAGALVGLGALIAAGSKFQQAKLDKNLLEEALKVLKAWGTTSEISADRAGSLCCGDSQIGIDCMVRLAIGSRSLAERVNVEEYLKQNSQLSSEGAGDTHPATVRRADALRKWFGTKKCRYLLEVADYCQRT